MTEQQLKAERFKALHVPGDPLVLFNIWDAGSAKAVAAANAQALATGSWAVAAALGMTDGETVPLDLVIANVARITAATALPVSVDIESGYDDPAQTAARTIEAGAIGCNVEDSFPADGTLRDVADQVDRLRSIRRAADASGVDYFINARTDVFFQPGAKTAGASMLELAMERARAYADAGADGIFVPGLTDMAMIAEFTSASPLPVNIMLSATSPAPAAFAQAGAARLSYGPAPYLLAMKALEQAAQRVFDGRTAGGDG
ncbi:isocitrate lyase/PEP mutase family protein [Hephaestia mangrovi]|uniref:isocitrate lyase/PEP mutase family protein n=1 Tax=Hephaestia mangrovi TaxID=2873268 RepID=UPI001CA7AEFA|nr:isocitrate lyase/phosphoenolpyruvate mutase family protein [Hephaestia mangrovi]MBY8828143.1 isocitrate lyase/phosphoenolpyruvate mutase family protein [Hephaestia mangrovi]